MSTTEALRTQLDTLQTEPAGPGPGKRASCGDSHLVINSTSDSVSDTYPDNRGIDGAFSGVDGPSQVASSHSTAPLCVHAPVFTPEYTVMLPIQQWVHPHLTHLVNRAQGEG